ncbi:transposase for IS2404, partial [mine drainage metagenome]
MEKAHGRIETRVVQTSTALNDYLDFPYVRQVFRIERSTTLVRSGQQRHEVAYGVTSCPGERADPHRMGELARGHWGIENKLHWVRDVVYDEDRSQIRTGRGRRRWRACATSASAACA